MTVSDSDLETIEALLDNELSTPEQTGFEARIGAETPLAAAVAEARQQRAVRTSLWQAIAPTSVEADRLTWRVRGAMRSTPPVVVISKSQSKFSSWRLAGSGSAAAACLLLGFMAGRVNQKTPTAMPSNPQQPVNIASADSVHDAAHDLVPTGQFTSVQTVGQQGRHLVPIVDSGGRVVAWQPFNDEEKAKNFAEDMNRANAPLSNGGVKTADQVEKY